ncbi:MAG: hypothetical protein ACT4PM_12480 [Gemmatimonadales bacterium]
MIATTSLLSTLVSLAAFLLGLSLLVQVIQEVYKYLTSSRSRSYERVLVDFLGPHALHLKRLGSLPDLQARGPFQFLRRRPTGRLQPMDRETLIAALERTAAPWIQRALRALHLEAGIQHGVPGRPTPSWEQFLRELVAVERGSPGYFTATELLEFLATWAIRAEAPTVELDAGALLAALRQRFLPSVAQVEAHSSQLAKNVEHAYRRRNLRHTITIGFLVSFLLHLPIDRLYQRASAIPLTQAIAAAEEARAIYAQEAARDPSAARSAAELLRLADTLRMRLSQPAIPLETRFTLSSYRQELATWRAGVFYLIGCLSTTLLVTFGAPFWNDLAGALLRVAKGTPGPSLASGGGEPREPKA